MNRKKRVVRQIFLIIGIILSFILINTLIFAGTNNNHKKYPKIGYVMTGAINDIGWNEMNYLGIKAACEQYSCKLLIKENVNENSAECHKAVEDLIAQGASVIFLSSKSYTEEVKDLITKNKKIKFYSNYSDFEADNLSTYFVRMYQARYLAGIIAGTFTKTNEIGYIASYESAEVNRGLAAFTLGVKRVNKNARVILKWTGDWDNEEAEIAAVKEFAENTKIDILTYHQNKTTIVNEADKYGIHSISYHTGLPEVSTCLASIVCDWTKVYENLLKNALYNKQNIYENYFLLGMEDEVVDLTNISDKVDNVTKIKIDSIKKQLSYGFNIFSGIIYDNNGVLRCSEDEAISDIALLENLNWIIQGVEIYGQ